MVVFDSSKIYEAILKASGGYYTYPPLIEAKLEGIANRIVAVMTTSSKYPKYEIQSIVEHENARLTRYAIAQNISTIVPNVILSVLKILLTSISPLVNLLIKTGCCSRKC